VISGPDQTVFPPLRNVYGSYKSYDHQDCFLHSIEPHDIMSDFEPSTQRTIPDGIYTLKQGNKYLTANAPGLPVTLNIIGIAPPQPNQKVNGFLSPHV
jgi:hypothetical protein